MNDFQEWTAVAQEHLRPFASALLAISIAALLGCLAAIVALFILRRIAARPDNANLACYERRWRAPVKFLFPLLFVSFTGAAFTLPPAVGDPFLRIANLLIIAGVAWFAIRTVKATEDLVQLKFDIAAQDNLEARKVHTQMRVLEKLLIVMIIIIAGALMLMTFERIRHLGVSIFASAGIAGIVLGFAAQRTLGNFIAGLQIAITQPIRIDDVVIVEGEWGVIEEITLTYVVVRIWDLRRLVLPINYFIEKPFQNWTRVSANILGTVFLHVDYRIPVEAIRRELQQICEKSPLWDGKACGLIVFDALSTTLQLRALVSARNAGQVWELRCLVREKLIEFIRDNYPDYLPRFRAELGPAPNAVGEEGQRRGYEDAIPEIAKPVGRES